jgi:hypothetical protein
VDRVATTLGPRAVLVAIFELTFGGAFYSLETVMHVLYMPYMPLAGFANRART